VEIVFWDEEAYKTNIKELIHTFNLMKYGHFQKNQFSKGVEACFSLLNFN
jgi:hypothetical protein